MRTTPCDMIDHSYNMWLTFLFHTHILFDNNNDDDNDADDDDDDDDDDDSTWQDPYNDDDNGASDLLTRFSWR